MNTKHMLGKWLAGAAFGAGVVLAAAPALAQFGPPELIEAARKEGEMTLYTANFTEVESEVNKAFNKRFPFIKISMVRAPGGQLITRVRTEAAANKLAADVVDHSDRGLMLGLADLFQDYVPPNAADYLEGVAVAGKIWPRATLVWSIAYNAALVKNPPKTWNDLNKAEYKGIIGQVLGEDYWKKQAATSPQLYPSGAPLSDALVRGEVQIAPLLYNIIWTKKKEGAPVDIFFPPEGAPINPYASGIPKSAAHPNAAKLYLNWCLSEEGQTYMIKELGNLTSLKKAPAYPEGFDPAKVKVWVPNFEEYQKYNQPWIAEWNQTYGYRQ